MTAAAEMPDDIIKAAFSIAGSVQGTSMPSVRAVSAIAQAILAERQRDQWHPISEADRSIATVQTFPDVGITLRNSYPLWVRDEDGRVYEAVWSEGTANYWWDLEGESPVDPVEFMPHPLDPRFAAPKGGAA